MFSETCLGCWDLAGAENPVSLASRAALRSDKVFARAGPGDSRLGGCGSALLKPKVRGSLRIGAVDVLAKPRLLGSIDFCGSVPVCCWFVSVVGVVFSCNDLVIAAAVGGVLSGLSSLLGGVLKGEILASNEGRR